MGQDALSERFAPGGSFAESRTQLVDGRRLDLVLVAAVTAACFVGILGFQKGTMGSWDGRAMASVARNLSSHGSIKECCNAFGSFPRDHSGYAKFGIGMSLVMAPMWWLDQRAGPGHALYLTLAGPFLLATTAGVIAMTGVVRWVGDGRPS